MIFPTDEIHKNRLHYFKYEECPEFPSDLISESVTALDCLVDRWSAVSIVEELIF